VLIQASAVLVTMAIGSEVHRAAERQLPKSLPEITAPADDARHTGPSTDQSPRAAGQTDARTTAESPSTRVLRVRVFDPLGAVVPGSLVTASETETGVEVARGIADRDGAVVLTPLEHREYRVTAFLRCFLEQEVTLRYSQALLEVQVRLPHVGCPDDPPFSAPRVDPQPTPRVLVKPRAP
jgi:hypothetical protein